MTAHLQALEALEKVIRKNPDLQEKLQSVPSVEGKINLLSEIAASHAISFDAADHKQFLASANKPVDTTALTESQLELVAAGGAGDDVGRGIMAVFYGTGVGGALVSIAAEISEPGGAKKMADYVFHGGPPLVPTK